MKIAHLILAHKNPVQVKRMVDALQHPAFHFYIHIDKKQDDRPFKTMLNNKKVVFLDQRVSIEWGGFGTIQATLNGFRRILLDKPDYINVISGQDFPIKSTNAIFEFYSGHAGCEFITCDHMGEHWQHVESRITDYHLINWRIPGKFKLGKLLTRILPARHFPFDYEIVGRANWFTLTFQAVFYILDFLKDNPQMIRYFKYCWGADEFIFSTILFNSTFKEKIRDNLVYVTWNKDHAGHPNVLGVDDLDKLKQSAKLYARKFDMSVDGKVLDTLESILQLQQ